MTDRPSGFRPYRLLRDTVFQRAGEIVHLFDYQANPALHERVASKDTPMTDEQFAELKALLVEMLTPVKALAEAQLALLAKDDASAPKSASSSDAPADPKAPKSK